MSNNFIRGSKGDLRRALAKAVKQIEEMTTLIAAILVRNEGELIIHGSEFELLEPGTGIGIKFDRETNAYVFNLVLPEGENDEQSLSAEDITGATRPVTGESLRAITK